MAFEMAHGGESLTGRPSLENNGLPPFLAGLSIAVIDDDTSIRTALRFLLAGWGCRVHVGSSFETMEPSLASCLFVPDVLVTDLHLAGPRHAPNIEGIGLFVERIGFHGPLIVMTGNSAPPHHLIEERGWALLVKPFRPVELCDLIGRLICPSAPALARRA